MGTINFNFSDGRQREFYWKNTTLYASTDYAYVKSHKIIIEAWQKSINTLFKRFRIFTHLAENLQ